MKKENKIKMKSGKPELGLLTTVFRQLSTISNERYNFKKLIFIFL